MTLDRRGLLQGLIGGVVSSSLWPRLASGRPGGSLAVASEVEAILLGNAQDAGVPQVNCFTGHCARVRAGEAPDPFVACLGLVDREAGRRFLIDATPDLNAQVEMLLRAGALPPQAPPAAVRQPGADAPLAGLPGEIAGRSVPLHEHLHGILLTHAHVGHYTGLMELGREIAATRGLPLYVTASMARFLRANGPWDALVNSGHVELREVGFGEPVALTERLTATPYEVIHRAEYTDTAAWVIRGPDRSLLYVPDADTWEGWPVPFDEILDTVDLALLDGSFWSGTELGNRPQSEVPHPPVSVTIERLGPRAGSPPVRFVHLNHTNPLWDPAAAERAALPEGFGVAETGERHRL